MALSAPTATAGLDVTSQGALPPDTVEVWIVDAARRVCDFDESVLSDAERQRANRFGPRRRRTAYVRTHSALRSILARWTGSPPQLLDIAFPDDGSRPVLRVVDGRPPVHFSISYGGARSLVAVGAGDLGVDIEAVADHPDRAGVVASWFEPAEARCIVSEGHGPPALSFLWHWTAKEAYLKARGSGIGRLRDVEVCCSGVPEVVWAGRRDRGRILRHLSVEDGYVAALVTSTEVAHVHVDRWAP